MYPASILFVALFLSNIALAQQPRYTEKHFVNTLDTTEFRYMIPGGDGFSRTYILTSATFYDIDDDNTTFIKTTDSVLLCIEGKVINKKREGIYSFYLIKKDDHQIRYKLWEQTFKNDKLNGPWHMYTLKGPLFETRNFIDNSISGLAQTFWIDGKTIMEEKVYQGNEGDYIYRNFHKNKKLRSEISYKKGMLNGVGKKYYSDGTLQEYAEFKDDASNGVRRYYYENGQLWIEQTYKEGKYWDVIANYTRDGKKRDAGTLKNGNGTVIYYNEDGSIRETETLKNGVLVK